MLLRFSTSGDIYRRPSSHDRLSLHGLRLSASSPLTRSNESIQRRNEHRRVLLILFVFVFISFQRNVFSQFGRELEQNYQRSCPCNRPVFEANAVRPEVATRKREKVDKNPVQHFACEVRVSAVLE